MTWDTVLMRLRHNSFLCRLVLTHVAPWIRVSIAWNRFYEVRAANAVGHIESAWCVRSTLGNILFAPRRWELTGYGWVSTLVVRRGCCYNNQLWNNEGICEACCNSHRQRASNKYDSTKLIKARTHQTIHMFCHGHSLVKYAPRLRSDDDTFTKPSARTKADLSISCVRRCEAHHMNSDLDGFNTSRLLV